MSLSIDDNVEVLVALHDARAKWRPIGLCIRVKKGDLDAIESEQGNAQRKLESVVNKWLENGENCTWSAIAAALRSVLVGEPELARKIERDHCEGVPQEASKSPAPSAAATVDVDSSVTSHSEQPDPPIRKEVCQGQPQHSETPSASTGMCLYVYTYVYCR